MGDPKAPEVYFHASSMRCLLEAILFRPHADHKVDIEKNFEPPLLNGHVASLYRILKKGARKAFPSSFTNDVGVALHCILSHFLGCSQRTMPAGVIVREFANLCHHGKNPKPLMLPWVSTISIEVADYTRFGCLHVP